MVVSSDTKKAAVHAIQKAGQGDFAGVNADAPAGVELFGAVVISARRQINGLLSGQARFDLFGDFISKDFMRTCFKR